MRFARSVAVLGTAILTAVVAFSGGTVADPPLPRGFPGVVPAFLADAEKDAWDGAGEDRGIPPARRGASRAAIQPGRRGAHRPALLRDQRWLARAKLLGDPAPGWARRMYRRSLLVLRAVVERDSGAAVAGAPAGWAYVWPRDAGAVAIALAEAGYRSEARRIARFLRGLDLDAAARFDATGAPVPGRDAQGDAAGWVAAAARAAGLRPTPHGEIGANGDGNAVASSGAPWRGHADYQEKDEGDYLGNAVASGLGSVRSAFATPGGLVRIADDPESGLDSAAAWAVRPFSQPALYPAVRRTLLRLVAERESRFGLLPSEDWDGGEDPWTAPTAWTAWALAALAGECDERGCRATAHRERRAALALMGDLRRAATPLGLLPERVDAQTGQPTSTTPLAWSHAFAILAIRELWPDSTRDSPPRVPS